MSLKCFGLAGGEEMGRRKVKVKRCQGNNFFMCNQQENCPSRVPWEEEAGQMESDWVAANLGLLI